MAIKKRREHNLETWILFLDLVKAFDRVPRELLWSILSKFGVSNKMINILKLLHATFKVTFEVDSVSHTMPTSIGVKQGDILGPALFIIFIAAVMITWRKIHQRPLCIFRTKNDSQLRRYNLDVLIPKALISMSMIQNTQMTPPSCSIPERTLNSTHRF